MKYLASYFNVIAHHFWEIDGTLLVRNCINFDFNVKICTEFIFPLTLFCLLVFHDLRNV